MISNLHVILDIGGSNYDFGIVPWLFYLILKCQNPKIMLRKTRKQVWLWSSFCWGTQGLSKMDFSKWFWIRQCQDFTYVCCRHCGSDGRLRWRHSAETPGTRRSSGQYPHVRYFLSMGPKRVSPLGKKSHMIAILSSYTLDHRQDTWMLTEKPTYVLNITSW